MAKRKLRQNQKESDDEIESLRPVKQFKKQKNSSKEISVNVSLSSDEELDDSMDSDIENSLETSDIAANSSNYDSFSSFLEAHEFADEKDDEYQKFDILSPNMSNGSEISMKKSEKRKSHNKIPPRNSSFHESALEEELKTNIRILSVPSQLTQVVLLQHPASVTLYGYVKVSVCLGSVSIFGYEVHESKNIEVFSTEGTGLKKAVTLNSVHKSTDEHVKQRLKRMTCYEDIHIKEFIDNIGCKTVVLIVKKLLLPVPLRFLELYYPSALQTRWARNENLGNEKDLELCSAEQSHVIDTSSDFETLSQNVQEVISQTVSDKKEFGPRILAYGEKNSGKSTLIRYLINSCLTKLPVVDDNQQKVYFLDTDPGQTEYTPPGVVSLFQVTKPLLGPTFAHQKQPLKMIFLGSVSPDASPRLYKESLERLMKYFNDNFPKEILFVNTMGWIKGLGAMCFRSVRACVKPTVVIELASPAPDLSLREKIVNNETTYFRDEIYFRVPSRAPSRESGVSSYSPKDWRNFNLVAYLGQCQKPYLPISPINSFHPVCVSWDKIALYVMGKKVPPHRLVEAMHCSIVALCHVVPSFVLKSDNPDFPMTLCDEPVCECLGFGLVRASDEVNRLFFIVTPLKLNQLKNVNALIKGNIMIPDALFLKQTIQNVPLPFSDHSKVAKTPARKAVCKRAHFRGKTPTQTP